MQIPIFTSNEVRGELSSIVAKKSMHAQIIYVWISRDARNDKVEK